MLSWVQLPALMEIALQNTGESKAIAVLEKAISRVCHAATDAGYNLDAFLKLLSGEPEQETLSDVGTHTVKK